MHFLHIVLILSLSKLPALVAFSCSYNFSMCTKSLVNCVYNCCPATLDTEAQSEDSIQSRDTLLPSTSEIENDVDGMPRWISGELFTGSGKKYEDLKEKQVLVFSETVRGKDICCSAEQIDYDKMLSMQVHQRTTQWHCPGCVTTHEGSGSLT